jgi:hypothetical protein
LEYIIDKHQPMDLSSDVIESYENNNHENNDNIIEDPIDIDQVVIEEEEEEEENNPNAVSGVETNESSRYVHVPIFLYIILHRFILYIFILFILDLLIIQ